MRTALLAWLFARSVGGRFIVRMEDLDVVLSRPEHADRQLADLAAIGLDWDGPVAHQSDRREIYDSAIESLTRADLTYPCYCTRREIQSAASAPHGEVAPYPGTCRVLSARQRAEREEEGRRPALRLRSDGTVVTVVDALCGPVTGSLDDVVLRRNDLVPSYNLAVVVDDGAQGVDQVVRGDDLLSSVPRQVGLARLLGIVAPSYAHVPLVLGPTGQRLAKRDGAVTLAEQIALGASADSVRSMLAASLGLCEPSETVSISDLLDRFSPTRLPRIPWQWAR